MTEPDPRIEIPGPPTDDETLAQVMRDNEEAIQRLARMGAGLDEGTVIRLQIGALVEHLFGMAGDPRRTQYELYYRRALARILSGAESQVVQAKLMQGVHGAVQANGSILLPGQG